MRTRHARDTSRKTCGAVAATAAALLTLAGCGGSGTTDAFSNVSPSGSAGRRVAGATTTIAGRAVTSWATVDRNNVVTEVGVTLPLAVIENPPTQPGSGPLGAIAVLPFPAQAQSGTFLNHFEMHWNPDGHEPARFEHIPHFDLHFYAVPEPEVRAIAPGSDPATPAANRVPDGYLYPSPNALVPQMGVHAVSLAEFSSGQPFSASMILGYYNGRMTFVEPMITQELLKSRQPISLAVARPAVLGRATRYPTRFTATFDARANAYQLVLGDFVSMAQ